jgi:hypothetical protein
MAARAYWKGYLLMEALRLSVKSKGGRAAALSASTGSKKTSKPRSIGRKRKAA